ncbi:galactosyl transferase, partial [Rhizodiscina lignyota]
PRPEQFVVLTASDGGGHNGGIENIMENALTNRQEYCDAHGYICHWVDVSRFDMDGAHPVWKKLPAIIETFQTYPDVQWVWMLDLDAIIMSPEIDIVQQLLSHSGMQQQLKKDQQIKRTPYFTPHEIDPRNIDLLMAQDHGNLNAGSFLVRRSEFSQWLLDMWTDPVFIKKADFGGAEQDAIIHFARSHPTVRKHLGIVPLRSIQSWLVSGEEMGWHKGDLVVHFAGCWVKNHCVQNWNKMWAQK